MYIVEGRELKRRVKVRPGFAYFLRRGTVQDTYTVYGMKIPTPY